MSSDQRTRGQIVTLMRSVTVLSVPYIWLKAFGNHTAAMLLADILSAYCEKLANHNLIWDGNELVLEFKQLQFRLGVSERSISRALDLLAKRKAVIYHRRDRVVHGTKRRNVVSVVPNMKDIAELSAVSLADILAAPRTDSTVQSVVDLAVGRSSKNPDPGDDVRLTDFQESLVTAYREYFERIVGAPYQTSSRQRLADRRAVARLTIPKARGAGHEYVVWSRQYLEALKDKAGRGQSDVRDLAFDRNGNARAGYTFEWFVEWARTDEPLPNGSARRSFDRGRPGHPKAT
jgi:hypothetical protein